MRYSQSFTIKRRHLERKIMLEDQNEYWLKAMRFALKKHEKQTDDDGLPYFAHVYQVANLVEHVTNDVELKVAALLHDTIEDTDTTHQELVENFGQRVADLVMELTHEGQKDSYGFYFPRLKSRDAILIKLADRMSNISRMDSWDDDRKAQYLRKTKFWKDGSDK